MRGRISSGRGARPGEMAWNRGWTRPRIRLARSTEGQEIRVGLCPVLRRGGAFSGEAAAWLMLITFNVSSFLTVRLSGTHHLDLTSTGSSFAGTKARTSSVDSMICGRDRRGAVPYRLWWRGWGASPPDTRVADPAHESTAAISKRAAGAFIASPSARSGISMR